jgi:uncharacterized membrane protein
MLEQETMGEAEGGAARAPRRRNVGDTERWASMLGGALIALYGLRRRDLTGAALALAGGSLIERGVTGHCRVYGALGLSSAEEGRVRLEQQHGPAAVLDASKAVKVERSVTIQRPPEELYAFWRNPENLPQVFRHLERVTVLSDTRARWTVKTIGRHTIEWTAEIHNDVPNEVIAWRSIDDATVPNAGSVRFRPAPGGRGTELKLIVEYDPPGGRVGARFLELLGRDPGLRVLEELRRLKRVMEAGEVPTIDGQPRGGMLE